jgi:predicted metal-binding protein
MDISKYEEIAKKHKMNDIILINTEDIYFDKRARLTCRWGCDSSNGVTIKCEDRGFSVDEAEETIKRYEQLFLLHANDSHDLTRACLDIERELFLDGFYFAFTLRACNYCRECDVNKGLKCKYPKKIRPCEEMLGIDVFKTVQELNLPIGVLKSEGEVQNRYGFVLIR